MNIKKLLSLLLAVLLILSLCGVLCAGRRQELESGDESYSARCSLSNSPTAG